MTTPRTRHSRRNLTWRLAGALLLGCAGASAAAPPDPKPSASRASAPAAAEQGPAWSGLKPEQRAALAPLERDWAGIDTLRKRKWLEIADRYPTLPPADQARLQARMTEWARLSPSDRSQARLQFQEVKQVPAQNRQASWEAYQALPPEQRQEFARRAAPAASAPAPATARPPAKALASQGPQPKSNTVPAPASVAPPKPVTPSIVQAQPGATTTLISKPPAPPAHQPTGQPKIAVTPEYVDKKTLLPQTGAQSAAVVRPASAPAPARP